MTPAFTFTGLLKGNRPFAIARIIGNNSNSRLNGTVKFYETPYGGVLVEAQIFGLPDSARKDSSGFYGMHIHEYGDCSLPFDKTGQHLNPGKEEHPHHAGDLPPLLSSQGYAFLSFYDSRFSINDIIDKSLVIHSKADDFTTQPSGNSGDKIGCGVIRRM